MKKVGRKETNGRSLCFLQYSQGTYVVALSLISRLQEYPFARGMESKEQMFKALLSNLQPTFWSGLWPWKDGDCCWNMGQGWEAVVVQTIFGFFSNAGSFPAVLPVVHRLRLVECTSCKQCQAPLGKLHQEDKSSSRMKCCNWNI